jgi:hypothetical protein
MSVIKATPLLGIIKDKIEALGGDVSTTACPTLVVMNQPHDI